MKYQISLFLLLLITLRHVSAQQLIARQNGGTPSFHTELDDAVTQAVSGDTLYLPGGYFPLNVPIDKELHIVGSGHHPNYSHANGITYISNIVYLNAGSSHSSFHGIYFQKTISVNGGVLTNLTFTRCNLEHFNYNGWDESCELKYSLFSENISRRGINCKISYSVFNNNFFEHFQWHVWTNCVFKNNIFMSESLTDGGNGLVVIGSFHRYENNIFLCKTSDVLNATGNSIYLKNIFVASPTFDGVNLIGFDNIIGQPEETLFMKLSGRTFLYYDDYRLKPNSQGVMAGTDGQDIGIYGGPSPWKEGSVPFNPHIEFKKVAGYTNNDGSLNVEVRVKAQER